MGVVLFFLEPKKSCWKDKKSRLWVPSPILQLVKREVLVFNNLRLVDMSKCVRSVLLIAITSKKDQFSYKLIMLTDRIFRFTTSQFVLYCFAISG